MGVLVDGVMAAEKSRRADVEPLLVGDLFGRDQVRCVTGARSGDSGIIRVLEGVAESDARRGGFDKITGRRAAKHSGLRGHDGESFYTYAEVRHSRFDR